MPTLPKRSTLQQKGGGPISIMSRVLRKILLYVSYKIIESNIIYWGSWIVVGLMYKVPGNGSSRGEDSSTGPKCHFIIVPALHNVSFLDSLVVL